MRSSASGGSPPPTASISPSRIRSQPPSCSVPASSMVATYAFASTRFATRATVSSAAVALVPAASVDLDALLALFNGAYADYFVPLKLDRAGLEFTIDVCDIELAASRVALEDDEPVAFALLALRGDEGWIGGMGTLPTHRRRGLGEEALGEVLSEAKIRGATSVRLEVIEQNEPARLLYEKLGFARERDLNVWVLDSAPPQITRAQPADPAEAHAWIRANRREQEPWQRADETLEHMRARGRGPE